MTFTLNVNIDLTDEELRALGKFRMLTGLRTDEASIHRIVTDRLRSTEYMTHEQRLVPREVDTGKPQGVEFDWSKGQFVNKRNTEEQGKMHSPMLTNDEKWDFIKDGFEVIPCANNSWVLRNMKRLDPGVRQDISSSVAFSSFGQLIAFLDDARTGNEPFVST